LIEPENSQQDVSLSVPQIKEEDKLKENMNLKAARIHLIGDGI
jgi:hypothetical protein